MSKIVIITGANRGIGLELAKYFSSNNWRVIGTSRNPETAKELAKVAWKVMKLDVSYSRSISEFISQLPVDYVDLLINNAGILYRTTVVDEVSEDRMLEEFKINALGPFMLTKALLPFLQSASAARILVIGSHLGSITLNNKGKHHGYRASKAAMHAFFKTIAIEHCVIPLLMVHPGNVKTDMGGADGEITIEESINNMIPIIKDLLEGNPMKWPSGTLLNSVTQEQMPF